MKEKRNDNAITFKWRAQFLCLKIPIRYLHQQDVWVQMANQEQQLDLIEREQKKNINKIVVHAVDKNDVD